MKKNIILIYLFLAATAQAQVLQVQQVVKLSTPIDPMARQVAAISPHGDYVLLCSQEQDGLIKFDLTTGESKVLTTARGAGFGTKISHDGNDVVYQEVTVAPDHLLRRSVKTIDLRTSMVKTITPPTRELQGFDMPDGIVAAVVSNEVKSPGIDPTAIVRPIVSNRNLKLQLTTGGVTRQFAPNGNQYNYIWASISPSGKRILYYVSELGCFTCNLDGSDMVKLGELRAPQWLDDNTVVGMRDHDDGITITSSTIVTKTLDGTEQTLTSDDMIAMFPSATTNKIAFHTLEGEIYIMDITITK